MSAVARRYFVRGKTALDRGELDPALETLRSAVDLAPGFVDARLAYAVALARFGDGPRAAQTLRAGLGRRSSALSEAALWATLGDVLTQTGDFPGATDAFEQSAQHPLFRARSAAGMARVHAKMGRYPEAFARLREAATAT